MRFVVLLISVIASVGVAWGEPVEWPVSQGGNGHYYEVVGGRATAYDGVAWAEADELAKAMSFQGIDGHLVSITSSAEEFFVGSLPEISCDIVGGEPCLALHVGGWSIVTGIIEPRPYNPPYVETTDEQWVTGEGGTVSVLPNAFVTGPIGEVLYFKWGIFDLDGVGYPDYGVHAVMGPSTAHGFVVEYDGLSSSNYPNGIVSTTEMNWGGVKSLYR